MGALEAVLVMGACFALVLQYAHAETHIVGGSSNWTIPQGNTQLYTDWVAGKTFKVGDVLEFNFNSGEHDVLEVTKTNYDACGKNAPLATHTTPPVNITLNTTGAHYYICSIGGHCTSGQKLAVTVVAASTPTTSPSPSPSSSTPPPPPSATPSAAAPQGASPSAPITPAAGGGSSSNGPSGANGPATDNSNSASRLTASLGILSGVATIFLL